MTGSWEYRSTDTFESVAEWYGSRLGSRDDLVGEVVDEDAATWVYEPSRYDNGIQIHVSRLEGGARILANTYVK